jgi:hypothetical protein
MRKSLSPTQSQHRYEPVISTPATGPARDQALYAPEIHTAVCVDEEQERSSRERELRPLSAKEKKRLDMSQKEVWQYVGRKIFTDKIFLSRRKKKATFSPEEDKEELKVSFPGNYLIHFLSPEDIPNICD